jgi:hypothetical protein
MDDLSFTGFYLLCVCVCVCNLESSKIVYVHLRINLKKGLK